MARFWLWTLTSILFCSLAYSHQALANDLELISSFHRGPGCYSENAEFSMGKNSMGFSYSSFSASLNPRIPASTAVTTCKWTGKFKVPPGYQMVIKGGVFKGHYTLYETAKTSFHSEIILDDRKHEASSFMLKSDGAESFFHDSSKYVSQMLGDCAGPQGGRSVVQFNSSMIIRSQNDERVYISQARLDGLEIPFVLQSCTK